MPISRLAYSIYSITKKFERCDNAYEQAEKGVKEMRKAKKKMNEIYSAVKEARKQLYEVSDTFASFIFVYLTRPYKKSVCFENKFEQLSRHAQAQLVFLRLVDPFIFGYNKTFNHP